MKTTFILLLILSVVGCAVPRYIPNPILMEPTSNIINKTFPELNKMRTVNIGETIAESEEYAIYSQAQVVLLDDLESNMDLGHTLKKPAGSTFSLFKHPEQNYLLGCKDFITNAGVGGPANACVVDNNHDGIIDATMFKNRDLFFPLTAPVRYKVEAVGSAQKSGKSFIRRLVFNGYSGGVFRIGYREFYGGTARPAFSEEYSLNISGSGTTRITVKTVDLSVEPFGVSGLKYIVHSEFQPSGWSPDQQ